MTDIPDKYQRKKDYTSIIHKEEPKPAFSSTIFDSHLAQEEHKSSGRNWGGDVLGILFAVFIISIVFGVFMVATTTMSTVTNTLATAQQATQAPAQAMQPIANQSITQNVSAMTTIMAQGGFLANFAGIVILLAVVAVVIGIIYAFFGFNRGGFLD